MANPALIARVAAQIRWPGAIVVERGRGHIKHRHPTESNQFMLDTQVGGVGWHYGPAFDQEVNTAWEPGVAPWQYQMVKAEFNAYLLSRLDAAFVGRYTDPTTGEYVEFDPQNLQWTNDLNQIQPISVPGAINAVINDDMATWPNGYGTGRHFSWQAQTARLEKLLTVDTLASLPTANSTIRSGGNPSLELQLTIRRSAGVQIWINGVRWNEQSNNNRSTSGLVEFRQTSNGQVLWWFNLPRSWDSAGNEVVGTFWFKKQGPSINVFHRIPLAWIEDAARVWPIMVDTTVDVQVGATGDDARRYYYSGAWTFSLNSPFGRGGYDGTTQQNGSIQRFLNVTIPNAATVNVAYLTFTAYATASVNTVNTYVACEDVDNAATYSTEANFAARAWTTTITWDSIGGWVIGTEYNSPSMVTPVQSVINRAGWVSSNALSTEWQDFGNRSTNSGNASRSAEHYNSSTTKCPKLHIEYTAGGASITLTADITYAGMIGRQDQKYYIGTVSYAGSLINNGRLTLSGALPFMGTIQRTVSRIFAGTVSYMGTLVLLGQLILKAAISFAGTVTKMTDLVLSRASSFSGALRQQGQRVVSGVLSFGGNLVKQGNLLLGSVASFAGSVGQGVATTVSSALTFSSEVVKHPSLVLPATLSFVGTVSKVTTATLSSALSFTGNLARSIYRNLSGTLSFDGALAVGKPLFILTLSAVLSFAGAVTKATSKTADASLSFSGAITKTVSQTLTGILSLVGDFAKWVTRHGNPTVVVSNTAVATLSLSNTAVATLSLSNAAVATLTITSEAWA